jgi:hypothetical protein
MKLTLVKAISAFPLSLLLSAASVQEAGQDAAQSAQVSYEVLWFDEEPEATPEVVPAELKESLGLVETAKDGDRSSKDQELASAPNPVEPEVIWKAPPEDDLRQQAMYNKELRFHAPQLPDLSISRSKSLRTQGETIVKSAPPRAPSASNERVQEREDPTTQLLSLGLVALLIYRRRLC